MDEAKTVGRNDPNIIPVNSAVSLKRNGVSSFVQSAIPELSKVLILTSQIRIILSALCALIFKRNTQNCIRTHNFSC
jgi:hypothetical protein